MIKFKTLNNIINHFLLSFSISLFIAATCAIKDYDETSDQIFLFRDVCSPKERRTGNGVRMFVALANEVRTKKYANIVREYREQLFSLESLMRIGAH